MFAIVILSSSDKIVAIVLSIATTTIVFDGVQTVSLIDSSLT